MVPVSLFHLPSFFGEYMVRYPVERTIYCKTVGKTRVENIAEILRSLEGIDVTIKEPEAHDVDMWVFNESQLIQVIEVLNWRRSVYLGFKRAMAIRENLNTSSNHGLKKLLIFSFWKNIENQMNFFDGLDVDFLEIGFQTQPVPYYIWFFNRRQASGMRPNDRTTKGIVEGSY